MAFHVACPLTCKRICFCELGHPEALWSPAARADFCGEVARVAAFLADPWSLWPAPAVQVLVPRVVVPPPPPPPPPPLQPAAVAAGQAEGGGDGALPGVEGDEAFSAQTKRAALQQRAAAASLAAEDYARRFEAGHLPDTSRDAVRDPAGEEQVSSVKVMCRLCFSGENEGSERAVKMLSCKNCGKKYHRTCLKSWAQFRDLFHWSSWTCPSCRICEVCRRTGDPNKFMFCKRCDGAYHCYCQHPPHKNVSSGPYLCPKHTRCHSCGSAVPGSGLSTRWFLGYTCCDACGRLFVKGKYCPVCLKVYRDSESTPMVCCDACQRWVHCDCDGISDEKYQQFQADGNLYYKCAACRGDCYQVKDINDAVQELWRRRDKADRDQIASLRAAAGLPSQEDVFSISPYSDDEDGPIILKNENGLKLSVKGFGEKAMKSKEYGKKAAKGLYIKKKYAKKKGYQAASMGKVEEPLQDFEDLQDVQSCENSLADESTEGLKSERSEVVSTPSYKKEKSYGSQLGIQNPRYSEVGVKKDDKPQRVVQIKSSGDSKSDIVKGTKLVIHLGARNKNISSSPISEASSGQRDHDFTASNGSEEAGKHIVNEKKHEAHHGSSKSDCAKGVKLGREKNLRTSSGKESGFVRLGKATDETFEFNNKSGRSSSLEDIAPVERATVLSGQALGSNAEAALRHGEAALKKHSKGTTITLLSENQNSPTDPPDTRPKDPKPLLKLKFKTPYLDNQSSWTPQAEEERSSVKGQRSKRKRPSPLQEKSIAKEDETAGQSHQKNVIDDEVMDANWILKKLGKDAIGKRVEVHQSSDNSWHKGVITDMVEGRSSLTVNLDDGRTKTLQLGKQGVRFISQKQKRSKSVYL